jgi:hypothetical protein
MPSLCLAICIRDRQRVQRWIDAESDPDKLLRSEELNENNVLNRSNHCRFVGGLVTRGYRGAVKYKGSR